jgi:hypothetical protein
MSKIIAELDKMVASAVSEGYGTMSIRLVVLKKNQDNSTEGESDVPADLGLEEVLPKNKKEKTPVDSFLEEPSRGKECCVFLINGQRQDAWDNSFIVRELDKKYLRNRTLIIVDLDGLKPEAIADLMCGDRQGFKQGEVYHAIWTRLVATLKKDPDLERLEADAEREISELRTGDEAVKEALDQLIEAHHAHAERALRGNGQPGAGSGRGTSLGLDQPTHVVVGPQAAGTPATGPYLVGTPSANVVRLHPGEPVTLTVTSTPPSAWTDVGQVQVDVAPAIDGVDVQPERTHAGLKVGLRFHEPEDWEEDQYPIETMLRVTAIVKGYEEPRLLERRIVITKPSDDQKKRKKKQVILRDDPTFLRVTSRQPVPLTPGGADMHVRLRWDGKDGLTMGSPPAWTFTARCATLPDFPPMTFSKPSGGRFELLIQALMSLTAGQQLEFEVEAVGPRDTTLKASFTAQVVSPPDPRRIKKTAPEPSSQRRRPKLHYIKQPEWLEKPCWDDTPWTVEDAGCFREPTESMPLVLIINEDMGLLAEYQESLKTRKRKLEAATIKQRVTRYTSHVAFHLYQMYLHMSEAQEAQKLDRTVTLPTAEQMRGEINRVAATLIKVMDVGQ